MKTEEPSDRIKLSVFLSIILKESIEVGWIWNTTPMLIFDLLLVTIITVEKL